MRAPTRPRGARHTWTWDLAYRRVGEQDWHPLDMEFPDEEGARGAAEHVGVDFPDIEFRPVPPARA